MPPHFASRAHIGAPIRGGWLAWAQQALLHAGTLVLVAGFIAGAQRITLLGGLFAWSGLAVLAARIWPVIAPSGNGNPARR